MVPKKGYSIRRAEAGDIDGILRLNFELFKKEQEEYDPELNMDWTYGLGRDVFEKCINDDSRFAAVAESGGRIIGYLCGSLRQEFFKNGQGAELDNMFVEGAYRNNGAGKGLITVFIDWCRAKKINYVQVRASARNRLGISFYKQNGFQDYDVVLENKLSKSKHMATKKEEKNAKREEFKVSGEKILEKVKELIKEGNVRRIIIINEKGETLMEIPLTFAVVGTAFAPVLAALGALAALIANCTIVVERK